MEYFDLLNHPDRAAAIGALAASIAAFLSAIATFWTVREMAAQRRASYKPQLGLSRVFFDAGASPLAAGSLPNHWVVQARQTPSQNTPTGLSIPLVNVGLGAATAVKVTWDFEIDLMIERLNESAQRTLTPLYFKRDKGEVTFKSENLGSGTSMWLNQKVALFDFITAASSRLDTVFATFPHVYSLLYSAIIFLEAKDGFPGRPIPPISATIDYSDVGGDLHRTEFDLNIEVIARASNGEHFTGYIESKKRV